MKIKDLLFSCSNDTIIGIKSLDHDEVFCYAKVESHEIMPYADREVLLMKVKTNEFSQWHESIGVKNYIEVVIAHKEELTMEEAIDVVLADTVGYLPNDMNQLAIINHRVDLLLELKEENYSIQELSNLRDFYHRKYRDNPMNQEACDSWMVYGQVLAEMGSAKVN